MACTLIGAATHGTGNGLNNVITANDLGDTLEGVGGNDLLLGGAANDVLDGGIGNDVLLGRGGDDTLIVGRGSDFVAGGHGNDIIRTTGGRNVIAFNRGDGADTLISSGNARNTISLAGISYRDLTLNRSGNDLVLDAGQGDSITFKDWYAGTKAKHPAVQLQFMRDGASDFDPRSKDKWRTHLVENFDLVRLAAQFDDSDNSGKGHGKNGDAHGMPHLTQWAVSDGLMRSYLGGNNRAALGGELAELYAHNGDLAAGALGASQSALNDSVFAQVPQLLQRGRHAGHG